MINRIDEMQKVIFGEMKESSKDVLGTKIKTYLNREEQNNLLWLSITAIYMKYYRISFASRGSITPEEHKNLKMSETYLKKFIDSFLERIDRKDSSLLLNKCMKNEIKVIDAYTKRRLYGEWGKQAEVVNMPREVFNELTDKVLSATCLGCTKHYSECNIHDIFMDNLIPESGFEMKNCRFAYTSFLNNENNYIVTISASKDDSVKFENLRIEAIDVVDANIKALEKMKKKTKYEGFEFEVVKIDKQIS